MINEELDQILNKFVSNEISLTLADISAAVKSREWLLDKIKSKIESKLNEPVLYKPERFVRFGSYFAGTKVKAVDELDFLVVNDSNSGIFSVNNQEYGRGLGSASPNHKYDQNFKKSDDSGVSPTKMLNWLKVILKEVVNPYGGEIPERDGQAITVIIKSKGLKFDFVPAGIFERSNGSGDIFYNIPKSDKSNGWIVTNPKKDIERVVTLAGKKSEFKNVIRLIKFIRNEFNMGISSYTVQTSICEFAENSSWSNSIFEDFLNSLTSLEIKLRNNFISDGFDRTVNLLEGSTNYTFYANRIKILVESLKALYNETDKGTCLTKLTKLLSNGKIEKSFDSKTLSSLPFEKSDLEILLKKFNSSKNTD